MDKESLPAQEREPKDISHEFLTLEPNEEFLQFLKSQRNEPALSITIDWAGVPSARRLKAFLESFNKPQGQKRFATIRATEDQHNQELNVFASGVKWEKQQD